MLLKDPLQSYGRSSAATCSLTPRTRLPEHSPFLIIRLVILKNISSADNNMSISSHISYFIFHISYFIFHISYFIFHISSFIFHLSSFIFHLSSFIFHISYFIFLLIVTILIIEICAPGLEKFPDVRADVRGCLPVATADRHERTRVYAGRAPHIPRRVSNSRRLDGWLPPLRGPRLSCSVWVLWLLSAL